MTLIFCASFESPWGSVEKLSPHESYSGAYTVQRSSMTYELYTPTTEGHYCPGMCVAQTTSAEALTLSYRDMLANTTTAGTLTIS